MRILSLMLLVGLLACSTAPSEVVPKPEIPVEKEAKVIPAPEIIPEQIPDYDTSKWTDLADLLPEAKLDIRYATKNNFVKEQLYECPRCWLRPDAAVALARAAADFKKEGYGLILFDCYRPRPVQEKLWTIMPNAAYVTPPSKGSMHNRGKAVDLSLMDENGNQIDMGTIYDFFGRPAHIDYRDHPQEILDRRDLLQSIMKKNGFHGIRTEWWHFSYGGKPAALAEELWPCK